MEVEQAYYRKTRMFPIMHTVAIRRSVYEQYPWVAMNLYKAFVQAQRECYEDLYVTAALKTSLPWLTKHVEDARALMGDDFCPTGSRPTARRWPPSCATTTSRACPNGSWPRKTFSPRKPSKAL
jgi:hypothetical protein